MPACERSGDSAKCGIQIRWNVSALQVINFQNPRNGVFALPSIIDSLNIPLLRSKQKDIQRRNQDLDKNHNLDSD